MIPKANEICFVRREYGDLRRGVVSCCAFSRFRQNILLRDFHGSAPQSELHKIFTQYSLTSSSDIYILD